MNTTPAMTFSDFDLSKPLLRALDEVGYETPSPIQAQTIPLLSANTDVVGQAQTGTGKTAAFALPLLSNLDLKAKPIQVLVLTPTRELAIQVAEAFQKYAKYMKGFHVLPVYGGQDYRGQIRALERGVHVVVGTPGRIMDHMRRGTLKLDALNTLVLDEADEMLRMGFIEDVEWILDKTPTQRQIALFSATMPPQIRRIATKYLKDPEHVTVKSKTSTASTIRQRYWPVKGTHKLDALTRILEAEPFDAMLVFVRTKTSTIDLAEKLEARGYSTAALNGDIPQNQRERTVENLKKGKIDIVVATDVAARGLDVARISHVINYDIPTDIEAYVHRIGRTGRAGRDGEAILFVAPRERRLQFAIEKSIGKVIEPMDLPSNELINDRRISKFKQRISDTLADNDLSFFEELIDSYVQENDVPHNKVAAALAQLMQGDTPFLFVKTSHRRSDSRHGSQRTDADDYRDGHKPAVRPRTNAMRPPEKGMERYRLEVGHINEVKPGNIVGAIANEAGIDSQYIGQIQIEADHSLVDLPEGMPKDIFNDLKKVRVCGFPMKISKVGKGKQAGFESLQDAGNTERKKPKRTTKKKNNKPKTKTKTKKNKDKGKKRKPDAKSIV
jgi:ATP-dependent RNA helicase DeaD